MSLSLRELLIRIPALLQRKTLLETKMFKTALFDYAINEKCCSVDRGRGICPSFLPHPGGFDSSRVPTPRNLSSKAKKKNANARGLAREGGLGAAGIDWQLGQVSNLSLVFCLAGHFRCTFYSEVQYSHWLTLVWHSYYKRPSKNPVSFRAVLLSWDTPTDKIK